MWQLQDHYAFLQWHVCYTRKVRPIQVHDTVAVNKTLIQCSFSPVFHHNLWAECSYVLLLFSVGFESLNPEQQMEFPVRESQHRRISLITCSHMLSWYLLAAGRGPQRGAGLAIRSNVGFDSARNTSFVYLVNTVESHMLAFDTDLSVAYLEGNREGQHSAVCGYTWSITSLRTESHLCESE